MRMFLKAFQVMGIISQWSAAALADGKITAQEGAALLIQLGGALGLPLEFDAGQLLEPPHKLPGGPGVVL